MIWLIKNLDLILSIIGSLLIAFSFGANLEGAYQTKKCWLAKNERKIYLASFLHPFLFKIGCGLLIGGFIITAVGRRGL